MTGPPPANAPEKKSDIDEHNLTLEQVCERYGTVIDATKPTNSTGLTKESAAAKLVEYGPNVLSPPKKKHPLVRYLEMLAGLFNLMLIVAGIATYVLYGIDPIDNAPNVYLGAILIAVAFLNAAIEFYQHQKSASILESFLTMIPSKCNAIRDGQIASIAAADLVPGDIVFIRMGDKVPADIRMFSVADLKVDNSSLTGESDPQERKIANTHKNPLEATNLIFNGSLAVAGEGYGIVIRTGDNTVLGQIANLTSSEKKRRSPLSEEIDQFVKIITAFAITTAIIFFIVGWVEGGVNFGLNAGIGTLVAWVPEGLYATISMLLTIAAKRMANKNALVKDLQGVETLGAITLLATDKTGTLTRNQMTVTNMWTNATLFNVTASADGLEDGEVSLDDKASGVTEIVHISAMCTRARFNRTDLPLAKRDISGDATESGLLRFASARLPNIDTILDEYPKVCELPFNSDTKWHLSINQKPHADGVYTILMKGAPERVLRVCSTILIDGQNVELTDDHRNQFETSYEHMAGKGHRVLAFAQLQLKGSDFPSGFVFDKEKKNFPTEGLSFVGLVSLEDPPKHGVREAIGKCRMAGVRVMMVTGDHPLTAEAIGRKINLMLGETRERVAKRTGRPVESIKEDEYNAIVIHGERIATLTDAEWDNIFEKDEIIFARTSPKNKLEIVKRAQALGHIVGVTGDGVNDSPALKKADLGIAMNLSGSDVSKEAAAMILLDDNFASTVAGIAEGRLIFANLKKSIQYTVTHSIPEVIPFLLSVVVPLPAALSSIQILFIDLGFELFAALSYAWEPPEGADDSLMMLPPRKPVTPESVERLRRDIKELQDLKLVEPVDPGNPMAEQRVISKGGMILNKIKRVFNGKWLKGMRESEGEVLVDGEALSWAYLEAGFIETIGGLVAFFLVLNEAGVTPKDLRDATSAGGNYFNNDNSPSYTLLNGATLSGSQQYELIRRAQSIYYASVLIMQVFNLFACKSKLKLPFGKHMVKNSYTWWCVLGALCVGVIVVYVPPLNIFMNSSYLLNPKWLLVPIGFGFYLFLYSALRRFILQKLKPIKYTEQIQGLMMFPTRMSATRTRTR
ncbi:P-type cation-transporting ATPase [Polychytrium aggregatum]|uniref:P-type cation-transporting ATPase n=1 Tax=Polychytrium aggregatum TaxID=110093 RepID=UPI0022FE3FE6|nr:P-type cation-transporting ATPase [Polychytrium aggregatum]KAI9206203.1 P-type cation-transporting ATPase [Polychytrium aggregatum]